MDNRREVRELFEAVFGDDPKWLTEAKRIERLVAGGQLEDASIALSHLLFERLLGQRRGIDVAIMQAAMRLLEVQVERRDREEIELLLGGLEGLAGPGLDPRAAKHGATRMPDFARALSEIDGDLARRAAAIKYTR